MFLLLLIAASFGIIISVTVPDNPIFPRNDNEDMRYFMREKSPGVYVVEDLLEGEINSRASEKDVTYYFFSPEDPLTGIPIKSTNIEDLKKTRFSSDRTSVFLIHGWLGHNRTESILELRKAMLSRKEINVFVVDWGPVACRLYASAALSVAPIGKLVGNFIKSLVQKYHVSLSDVTLIGFSLGAHVAGNAGATLNGEVDQIIGLDPAGPLFYISFAAYRIKPHHGRYVHIIHTNTGVFGYEFPCGHSDYYPNGGAAQPGCKWYEYVLCAHYRSYEYYAESVKGHSSFSARKCSSYFSYKQGYCKNNHLSVLGGYPVDKRAKGTYYLDTNGNPPYGKGPPSIHPRNKRSHTSTYY